MKLTVVIPALNEQEAIASTIERCLAARARIIAESPVSAVEVIVVSDGSTDRTAEIAAGYPEAELIVFEKNRGYGAAIKAGFEAGHGELVGFLDADGTCDPLFFADLCTALVNGEASVALGSRMGPASRMPRIRRLGNRIYALILSVLSNRVVTDSASGMRVIRRDVLPRLYPLPDGLHFTPAMSARVLMDDHLKIAELPMAYEERIGDSKLHVLRDGVRFLHTILEMTLMWRPAKVFTIGADACAMMMTLLSLHPIETWLRTGALAEDMIYRLLFCSFLGMVAAASLSAGVIAGNLQRLFDAQTGSRTFFGEALDRIFSLRGMVAVSALACPLLAYLIGPGIVTRLTDGHVYVHWSRVVLAGLIAFTCGQMLIGVLIANIIRFHTARRSVHTPPREKRADGLLMPDPTTRITKTQRRSAGV